MSRRRARMVAGLLTPACPDCEAAPGAWCDYMSYPPAEMIRVDRPAYVVHATRTMAAVAGQHVNRRTLAAQFAGGPLPAGL